VRLREAREAVEIFLEKLGLLQVKKRERYFLIVGGKEEGFRDGVRRSGAIARFDGIGGKSEWC